MIHREFRTAIRGKITKYCQGCCLLTVESERFGTVVLTAKDVAPDAMKWNLVEVTAGSVLRDDDEIFSGGSGHRGGAGANTRRKPTDHARMGTFGRR